MGMSNEMRKILIPIICIAILLGMMACTRDDRKNEVAIAYFDNITHGQALIMKNKKALENLLGEDIKVNWVAFNAGPAEVEACFAGDIDIGYIGPVPASTANIKSDGDFVIISGAANNGAMLLARKEAGIENVQDLEGKKVAIPGLGNTQHLLLLDLLEANKLSAVLEGGTVDVVEVQNADVINLFHSGEIDAALVPEPWGTTILKNSGADIVLDYDEFQNGEVYSTTTVIVNKTYMEEHREIVEKFLQAHIAATKYIVQYPEEACKIMNAQLYEDTGKGLEEDIITEAIGRIEFDYIIPMNSILNYSETCVEQKFINKKLEKDAFDSRLLNQLLE